MPPASGIISDPNSQERFVPESRRADGSVRKQQRVRTGFTPAEDISPFRSARRAARDPAYAAANPGLLASSQRTSTRTDRKQSQTSPGEKVEMPATKAKAEEDDLTKAFEKISLKADKKEKADETPLKGSEDSFPPLQGGGAPKETSIAGVSSHVEKEEVPSATVALESTPPGPAKPSDPAPLPNPSASRTPSPLAPKKLPLEENATPSIVADRAAEVEGDHNVHKEAQQPLGTDQNIPSSTASKAQTDESFSWRSNGRPAAPSSSKLNASSAAFVPRGSKPSTPTS